MIIRATSAAIAAAVVCSPACAQSTSKQINSAVGTAMSMVQTGDPLGVNGRVYSFDPNGRLFEVVF